MTPRQKRMAAVAAIVVGVGAATLVASLALKENLNYFYSPSQVAGGEAPASRAFRLGGLVTAGSVQRAPGSLDVRFVVTDYGKSVPVSYTGLLPDLFKEGKGVIAHGRLDERGTFVADEVLAKHDENYMPPEVAASLKQHTGAAGGVPAGQPPAQAPAPGGQGGAP